MPPKVDPVSGSSAASNSEDGKSGSQASSNSPADMRDSASKIEDLLQHVFHKLAELDSKIEAKSLVEFEALRSPTGDHDFSRSNRQSFGSLRSASSQELVVRKSSFRLEKPKFEPPKDPRSDGSNDEAVLRYFDDCDRHIEVWKSMPENVQKTFEGSENFALVSLPPAIQKNIAHSLDLVYAPGELVMWTVAEIKQAKYWKDASTSEIRRAILVRKAQNNTMVSAIRSIQPPAIAFAPGAGLIHLEAFNEYKDKMVTQIGRLAEGGVELPLIAIKDAIISAIPDVSFKTELYSLFGHANSIPGPSASGETKELSIKSLFEFIHEHIVKLKKMGFGAVNKAVYFSAPPYSSQASRKFGPHGPPSRFPPRAVQAIEHQHEFPVSDREFWSGASAETETSAEDSDEFHQVNAMVQKVKSKECHYKGVGPDGKLLCPYLGNPDTAKCGFIHPAKELELKGRGVSKSTPVKPKTVHNIVGGLGIEYIHDSDFQDDGEDREL